MSTTILLVDDHEIFRRGLRRLLETDGGYIVIGETCDGTEAVHLVEILNPQIVVMDIVMPIINGIDTTQMIKQRCPDCKIIILSMHDDESYVVAALQSGADGYILKDHSVDELLTAINETLTGKRYLSPPISNKAIELYLHQLEDTAPDPMKILTSREREILYLVVDGLTSSDIARRLYVSTRTVENHRSHLMHKLGLHSINELRNYLHGIKQHPA